MDPRKRLVRDCYDAVADRFAESWRRRPQEYPQDAEREQAWYLRFFEALPRGARVLDVGCGNGESALVELLARGCRAVGVDLSHQQAIRAHARCPAALVLEGEMTEVEFADGSFDGLVAVHSMWNVPRQEHAALFARARRWLVDGGVALLTLGAIPSDDDAELFTDLLGVPTYYDARTADASLQLLTDAGFTIEDYHRPDLRGVIGGVLIVLARARR
jgi:cyclopropane fatty-acyl-phospholipid synthase-like methyltransferase